MRLSLFARIAGPAGLLLVTSSVLLVPGLTAAAATAAPLVQVCPTATAGHAACQAIQLSTVHGGKGIHPDATPTGYGPTDIQSAYDLPATGAGETVAIVDAYDDPSAESDLGSYRSQYGLSACTTANGCFKKVNQSGGTSYPTGNSSWGEEMSLDLDAVSAACPKCGITLVEANDASNADLYAADNEAVTLGAKFVSNSWSGAEYAGQTSDDSNFHHPGVLMAFATGDAGYQAGTQYPASSQYTLAVGGTSLSRSSGTRGWTETVWNTSSTEGTGSGCSAYEPTPSWQAGISTGCGKRGEADISADADPNTGLAIYDSYGQGGWLEVGGTSLATPLITSMYALAGTPGSGDNPASYPYAHTSQLNDVTQGSNGSCGGAKVCTAGTGWDGPTGLGTPNGVGALTAGSSTGSVGVANPGNQGGTVGTAVSLSNSATGGSAPYSWTATGLPAGLAINASSGTVTGTPTTAGSSTVTITAKDSTGATGSTSFTWTVNGAGGGGTVTVTSPGTQYWFTGYSISALRVKATDSKGLGLSFTATGLPAGLSISSTGTVTGTPTTAGTSTVKVTATDTGGGSGSTTFSWTIYSF
jgi:subtilase family serine protease